MKKENIQKQVLNEKELKKIIGGRNSAVAIFGKNTKRITQIFNLKKKH
ncbi:bacteriocin [Lactobacillus intestinalis]|nr:bacteriocin [Lactobacillus intestinalis]UTW40632.1 bacteriocin [Lactobacillus intestinalis]